MKSAPTQPPTFKADAISLHHGLLKADFAQVLEGVSGIRHEYEDSKRWRKRPAGQKIPFYLWGVDPKCLGIRGRAGSRCPIVRAKNKHKQGEDSFAWVAWREMWYKDADDAYILADASFSYFWGSYPYERPLERMLFRAEWTQFWPEDEENRFAAETHSGHPHWQVEHSSPTVGDVSAIHLGMTGWDRSDGLEFPGCWQYLVKKELDVLRLWATRTLEYSIYQISNCYKSD